MYRGCGYYTQEPFVFLFAFHPGETHEALNIFHPHSEMISLSYEIRDSFFSFLFLFSLYRVQYNVFSSVAFNFAVYSNTRLFTFVSSIYVGQLEWKGKLFGAALVRLTFSDTASCTLSSDYNLAVGIFMHLRVRWIPHETSLFWTNLCEIRMIPFHWKRLIKITQKKEFAEDLAWNRIVLKEACPKSK